MINRLFAAILIITGTTLVACGDAKPSVQAPPPVPVSVYTVASGDATFYDQYPASITALNEVQIRTKVTGYITGIYFKDGQVVQKGMKLYSIDQQQYQAGYDQSV